MKIEAVMKINAWSNNNMCDLSFFLTGIFSVQTSPTIGSEIMAPYDEKDLVNRVWHLGVDMHRLKVEAIDPIMIKRGIFRDCIWLSYPDQIRFLRQDDLIDVGGTFFDMCLPDTCKWHLPYFSAGENSVHEVDHHLISIFRRFVGPGLQDFNPGCDFFQQALNFLD